MEMLRDVVGCCLMVIELISRKVSWKLLNLVNDRLKYRYYYYQIVGDGFLY